MTFLNQWLLTILLFLPIAGAVSLWFVRPVLAMRWTAIGIALASFCLSILILIPFKWQQVGTYNYGPEGTVQMPFGSASGPRIQGRYKVAIDGISFPFVVLTTLVCSAACAASLGVARVPRLYFSLLLLFEAATLGSLLAFNAVFYFASLLAAVIPAVMLLLIWGGERRANAAGKFLAFMVVSSICLGIALFRHRAPCEALDLIELAHRGFPARGRVLFLLALVAFLIRFPTVPFHGWMPDILAEAPGPVGAMIGALVSLTGGYGILRIVLPIFPHSMLAGWSGLTALSVVTILIGSLRAWSETNLGRSIAYATVAMLGFALLGISTMTGVGVSGAIFVLVSQGLIFALMALVIGRGQGTIYLTFFGVAWFAELVVPGMIGFLTVLLGVFEAARSDSVLRQSALASPMIVYGIAIVASVGWVILAVQAASVLRRVFSTTPDSESKTDNLKGGDIGFLAPLAAIIILLGILPAPFCFGFCRAAVDALLKLLT